MIKVFEAVTNEIGNGFRVFLAGGITNCPDWQSILISKIKNANIISDLDIYNPRRKWFPIRNKSTSYSQIKWEFDKLKIADMIIYWFSNGSLNPISLYELGMWGNSRNTHIIIGIDSEYERRYDVVTQTALARPEVSIVYSLDEIVELIRKHVDNDYLNNPV